MKLVIISNMAHYRRADGTIVGHGATARELSVLAELFDEVRHVACLHAEPPPASALPYTAANLELVPVPPAGGDDVLAKLDIFRKLPLYAATIRRELRGADAVHVRCPANISMVALGLLETRAEPHRRWIKYAGSWEPRPDEPLSYRLQREWLARPHRHMAVSVNGAWPEQPPHVHTLANPCLTDDELERGRAAAARKSLRQPLRLLFVGHLGAAKNPEVAIEALADLRARGVDAMLDVVGEGDNLDELRAKVAARELSAAIDLHGPLPRNALDELYAAAHFVVLPSRTEGWPKVLGEGMAFGAVPIATAVGSIPSVLAAAQIGHVLELPPQAQDIVAAIRGYLDEPARWQRESARAVDAAASFSFSAYREAVRGLLEL
ncbi:MAG TPA: glycosyltransferase [Kofleriaceae bacterium]